MEGLRTLAAQIEEGTCAAAAAHVPISENSRNEVQRFRQGTDDWRLEVRDRAIRIDDGAAVAFEERGHLRLRLNGIRMQRRAEQTCKRMWVFRQVG